MLLKARKFLIREQEFFATKANVVDMVDDVHDALKTLPHSISVQERSDVIGDFQDNMIVATRDSNIPARGGDDQVIGSRGQDKIYGGDGQDKLYGKGGDDAIDAGDGNDVIYGGGGHDWLRGGDGDDIIYGGRGLDRLRGDDGDDIIYGNNAFFNKLYGGAGDDVVYGRGGHDWIWMADGDDLVFGGRGYDSIRGGAGDDTLHAGKGADTVHGDRGEDKIVSVSDAGRPTFTIDNRDPMPDGEFTWDDVLYGGSGQDTFVFRLTMNAKRKIMKEHADENGVIDWNAIMMENDRHHDHWVDWLGLDEIMDYQRGERIVIEGHTVAVGEIRYGDMDGDGDIESMIPLYSDQAAMGVTGGAHDRDFLGCITVHGARVDYDDLEVDAGIMHVAFKNIDQFL